MKKWEACLLAATLFLGTLFPVCGEEIETIYEEISVEMPAEAEMETEAVPEAEPVVTVPDQSETEPARSEEKSAELPSQQVVPQTDVSPSREEEECRQTDVSAESNTSDPEPAQVESESSIQTVTAPSVSSSETQTAEPEISGDVKEEKSEARTETQAAESEVSEQTSIEEDEVSAESQTEESETSAQTSTEEAEVSTESQTAESDVSSETEPEVQTDPNESICAQIEPQETETADPSIQEKGIPLIDIDADAEKTAGVWHIQVLSSTEEIAFFWEDVQPDAYRVLLLDSENRTVTDFSSFSARFRFSRSQWQEGSLYTLTVQALFADGAITSDSLVFQIDAETDAAWDLPADDAELTASAAEEANPAEPDTEENTPAVPDADAMRPQSEPAEETAQDSPAAQGNAEDGMLADVPSDLQEPAQTETDEESTETADTEDGMDSMTVEESAEIAETEDGTDSMTVEESAEIAETEDSMTVDSTTDEIQTAEDATDEEEETVSGTEENEEAAEETDQTASHGGKSGSGKTNASSGKKTKTSSKKTSGKSSSGSKKAAQSAEQETEEDTDSLQEQETLPEGATASLSFHGETLSIFLNSGEDAFIARWKDSVLCLTPVDTANEWTVALSAVETLRSCDVTALEIGFRDTVYTLSFNPAEPDAAASSDETAELSETIPDSMVWRINEEGVWLEFSGQSVQWSLPEDA